MTRPKLIGEKRKTIYTWEGREFDNLLQLIQAVYEKGVDDTLDNLKIS